jgi:NADH-quinone oxidoreductase subunit K
MILPALFFYLFSGACIASAFMVIASRNPVHSVLYLILAFVNAAGLFVLMGAEFLAMILIVVYVGAVAVLFLFVVMMLDVDFAELRQGFLQYLPFGALVGVALLGDRAVGAQGHHVADPGRHHQHRGARPRALYEIHLLLPGGGAGAAGRDGGRHRADAAPQGRREAPEHRRSGRPHPGHRDRGGEGPVGAGTMTIGLGHYLSVAAILFTLGIFGIFINRKNVIVILMSIELILLAVNINLVAFSTHLGDLVGQVFAMLVLTVAAAEAAIGLAILVVYFRNRGSIAVEDINLMKG